MNGKSEDLFSFISSNPRLPKPRNTGLTEIRGPYYSVMGINYLEDVLNTMHHAVDILKFAGGSFTVIDPLSLRRIIDLAHKYEVKVSTGGFIEYVLTQGVEAVKKYIRACADAGFDIIEISSGFITIPTADWIRLIREVHQSGLKVKAEVGIQFGAGGSATESDLRSSGTRDVGYVISQAKKFLDEGVYMLMIESEGITENVHPWKLDVISRFITELGYEKLMFEAADPHVFEWLIHNYGYDLNLFVDHSQIVQLECIRRGIWGSGNNWGRIRGYK